MADTAVEEPQPLATEPPPERPVRRPRRRWKRWVALLFVLVLLAGGYFLWRYLGTYESTDDAQVDGHLHSISARISGHIIQVPVFDQQIVNKGDLLAVIDPRDYEVAVARAEADVADARATFEASRTNVPITSTTTSSNIRSATSELQNQQAGLLAAERQLSAAEASRDAAEAQVREAEANYQRAADDVARYKLLVDKDEISRQQYVQAVETAEAARAVISQRRAQVSQAEENIRVASTAIEQAQARIAQAQASLRSAETGPQQVAATRFQSESSEAKLAQQTANLAQARLNLSYTKIFAPAAGIVGKKTVEVGQNVTPGQLLMSVVQLDDVWVTANFKETQLRRMQPGQRVRFSVDAYKRDYDGLVTGIGGASGSRFSLLPPENATGNYVKVVQRIPVRIDLDPNQNRDRRLRPGMSVEPKVYLH